jgi:lipoprotein-anchoring transpeptidase ErfK/SrfK
LGLLIVVVVIAFVYGPFGADAGDEDKAVENEYTADLSTDVVVPKASDTAAFVPQPREESVASVPPAEVVVTAPEMQETVPVSVPEPEPEPKPTVEANPDAGELIAEATALIKKSPGKIIEVRDTLNRALRMPMSVQQRTHVKAQLSALADKWLLTRTVLPNDPLCENYQVRSGDLLTKIGDRYKVPYEILMTINKIARPQDLRAGEPIKVINGPFRATVYRSTFTMDVYLQNTFVRSFRVGLGKPGHETPTGLWRVKPDGKLVKPIWTDPADGRTYHPEDPDYPLGSRWIALEGLTGAAKYRVGFAIHGTKEPEQIGTAGSAGCIRMHNGDAILVYNMMFPGFSQVEVVD